VVSPPETNLGEKSQTAANVIEIRIEEIAQLFHSLDPFPFREKDLDKEAEEFIVSWARELPMDRPFRIVVHLPDTQAFTHQRPMNSVLLSLSIFHIVPGSLPLT
jgi:hypothetical protein